MTQENRRAPGYHQRQVRVSIGGKYIWADKKMVPLLRALNNAGLITRSHCEGHNPNNPSWVAIRMESITGIQIRNDGEYRELLLSWRKK